MNIKESNTEERTKTYVEGLKSDGEEFHVGHELGKFLLKKDLSIQRLRKYNDDSIDYLAWTYTFKSVITDLDMSPVEECDLLINWLGPELA